jgi:uncharacterized protein YdhG (YjbR/CyaY superfamily)
MNSKPSFHTIDEYIASFPSEIQNILQTIRTVIQEIAPNAIEAITYSMPTFKLNGNLVHFAAMKNHIGFYPAPSGIKAFENELKPYKTSKGAIQFPLDKEIPLNLIAKITEFRVTENLSGKK